ncbi:MAG TPA: hypothetical protein PKD58_09995, partial [Candidatus Sumerlaeota bacterium]|nr:hypothetical protein [Candidatus Sumerlaeota bacterium]
MLAALMATASAFAAPTISGWSITSQGSQEKVLVRWNETGATEMNEWAQARQVALVLPEATLAAGIQPKLNLNGSKLIQRARLQEVTRPDGSKAVQAT